jgi:phospholipid transport system transporter-binding protein
VSKADIRRDGEVLRISGELTFSTVTGLLGQSRPLFEQSGERVVVDLGGVERADSAGLAMLIEWMRLASARGCAIEFSHLPAQMLDIAVASDLDDILPLSR